MTTTAIETTSISKILKSAKFLVFDCKNDNSWEVMNFQQVCNGLIAHGYMSAGSEIDLGIVPFQASERALPIMFEDWAGNEDFAIQMF